MERLDPSRFPGNPAMVEQLRTQVLASVDKLEPELRRDRTTNSRADSRWRVGAGSFGLSGCRRGVFPAPK